MAKKRIEQNENIFVKYQKLKKAEEIFKKYETITLSDIYVVISRFLPETENYNSFKGAVGDNPPNLIPSKKLDNDSKSSIITEERNNVQKEEELNTQKTSKSSCSSKELTEDLLQEKERILAFFEANKERGITRTEITAYLAVKEYRTAKKKIKALGIPDVLKYVVDLRSSISVPAGSPIYPDGYTSVNRIEDNKISSKQDENSSKQDENGSKQDENGLKQDENSSKQDEIISKHDENDIQKKEESKRVVALETQSFEKKDDSKSVLLLSELFGVQQKKQNYIIGLDLFNQRLSLFLELLDELLKPERIPCFWLWESDLIELDKLKEESALARNLIKFFAQDERDYYSHLVDGPKPKNMIEFCKKNDITFITGVPIDILNFKLEGTVSKPI